MNRSLAVATQAPVVKPVFHLSSGVGADPAKFYAGLTPAGGAEPPTSYTEAQAEAAGKKATQTKLIAAGVGVLAVLGIVVLRSKKRR